MRRILLFFKHKRTARILEAWLAGVGQVCTAETTDAFSAPFDLCIVDSTFLRQMRETLRERKEAVRPRLIPVLLILSPHEMLPSMRESASPVDDMLVRPLREPIVRARVCHLLHLQHLSHELQARVEEHAKTVEALEDRERHYRNLFENASDGIATFDLDGTVTSVNRELEAMLARPRAELIGRHYREFTTPASCLLATERANHALVGQPVSEIFELEFVHGDGKIRVVEVRDRFLRGRTGQPSGFQGIYRDITERRRMEVALRQSEERFRLLSASSPIGIYQNDAHGACLYSNLRWQEISGLSSEETLGTGWTQVIAPEDREVVLKEWQACVREGREFSREFRLKRRDGEIRWVHSRAAALRADAGELLGYVGTTEDITDQKRIAEALQKSHAELEQRVAERTSELAQANDHLRQEIAERKRLQEQLVERERLAALGRITGAIAHELGTPLNSVLGYAQLLGQTAIPDSAKRRLKIIESQAQRMAEIIQHYLSRTRDVRPSRQKVYPKQLVQDALAQLALRFEQFQIQVQTTFADALPSLIADAASLQRMLMNVLNNAVDAQQHGGTIVVTTRPTTPADGMVPGVVIEITDSGQGIAPEVLPKVFDLFFTTKSSEKGNGLGLAICQEIAQAHGGTIHVSSKPKEGTRVDILLPVEVPLGSPTGATKQ